ncbi:MAG: radical SAM protein [Nitrospirae bacterium]|nr:radical SAM protein [Nitrospirota bacterium]
MKNITYFLPCKPSSIYINIDDRCLNDCLFCIKREGPVFYGSDLSLTGNYPSASEIVLSLKNMQGWDLLREIVFCGMGEPLLRYDCVLDVCSEIRELRKSEISIRVDTAGLWWSNNKRLDILDHIDILSVSLNAENTAKYEELCNPKIDKAYDVLMDFLKNIKNSEETYKTTGRHFPQIRLSIVDTSEEQFIPTSGRQGYAEGTFPVADYDACKKIADSFGWPLILKKLFRDSRDEYWKDKSFEESCARGIPLEFCKNCSYRH